VGFFMPLRKKCTYNLHSKKYLDYHIKVNNIPKLIKDFNDDAIKNYQLNATGICNAQGIY
jgi:hypothetical protein